MISLNITRCALRTTVALLLNLLLIFTFTAPGRAQSIEIVHDFEQSGASPQAAVIEGSDGFLYGTTAGGGAAGRGTLFKVAKDGSEFTLLKSFKGGTADGSNPSAALIEGSDGFLYGTTPGGGAAGQGTLFKIAKDGSGFTVLKSFGGGGSFPRAAVIEGSDGFLYGTAIEGGTANHGTLFKIAKDGSGFTVLKSFGGTDGSFPASAVTEGSDGFLYGTTASNGGIFKVAKDGSGFTVLKFFGCGTTPGPTEDGCIPVAAVIEGSDGFLYGTAQGGGTAGEGTLFKIVKDGSGFTVLKSFGGTDGRFPVSAVTEGSDGFLYGTTQEGAPQARVQSLRQQRTAPPSWWSSPLTSLMVLIQQQL